MVTISVLCFKFLFECSFAGTCSLKGYPAVSSSPHFLVQIENTVYPFLLRDMSTLIDLESQDYNWVDTQIDYDDLPNLVGADSGLGATEPEPEEEHGPSSQPVLLPALAAQPTTQRSTVSNQCGETGQSQTPQKRPRLDPISNTITPAPRSSTAASSSTSSNHVPEPTSRSDPMKFRGMMPLTCS